VSIRMPRPPRAGGGSLTAAALSGEATQGFGGVDDVAAAALLLAFARGQGQLSRRDATPPPSMAPVAMGHQRAQLPAELVPAPVYSPAAAQSPPGDDTGAHESRDDFADRVAMSFQNGYADASTSMQDLAVMLTTPRMKDAETQKASVLDLRPKRDMATQTSSSPQRSGGEALAFAEPTLGRFFAQCCGGGVDEIAQQEVRGARRRPGAEAAALAARADSEPETARPGRRRLRLPVRRGGARADCGFWLARRRREQRGHDLGLAAVLLLPRGSPHEAEAVDHATAGLCGDAVGSEDEDLAWLRELTRDIEELRNCQRQAMPKGKIGHQHTQIADAEDLGKRADAEAQRSLARAPPDVPETVSLRSAQALEQRVRELESIIAQKDQVIKESELQSAAGRDEELRRQEAEWRRKENLRRFEETAQARKDEKAERHRERSGAEAAAGDEARRKRKAPAAASAGEQEENLRRFEQTVQHRRESKESGVPVPPPRPCVHVTEPEAKGRPLNGDKVNLATLLQKECPEIFSSESDNDSADGDADRNVVSQGPKCLVRRPTSFAR